MKPNLFHHLQGVILRLSGLSPLYQIFYFRLCQFYYVVNENWIHFYSPQNCYIGFPSSSPQSSSAPVPFLAAVELFRPSNPCSCSIHFYSQPPPTDEASIIGSPTDDQ
ncbi:hypothetical protein QQ045_013621 [Rhodiola kirilowii]